MPENTRAAINYFLRQCLTHNEPDLRVYDVQQYHFTNPPYNRLVFNFQQPYHSEVACPCVEIGIEPVAQKTYLRPLGGSFRGAFQTPVIEELIKQHMKDGENASKPERLGIQVGGFMSHLVAKLTSRDDG